MPVGAGREPLKNLNCQRRLIAASIAVRSIAPIRAIHPLQRFWLKQVWMNGMSARTWAAMSSWLHSCSSSSARAYSRTLTGSKTQARPDIRADGIRRRHLSVDRAREREGVNVRRQGTIFHAGCQAQQLIEPPLQDAFRRRGQMSPGGVAVGALLMG